MVNNPTKVILHCSATQDYVADDPAFDSIDAGDIKTWHLKRGFADIGYHRVIRRTGVIEFGRPIEIIGAHTEGHNAGSIGVCWVGTRWPTDEQIQSIIALHLEFWRAYGIKSCDWFGHREFGANKDCPGIPMNLIRTILDSKERYAGVI